MQLPGPGNSKFQLDTNGRVSHITHLVATEQALPDPLPIALLSYLEPSPSRAVAASSPQDALGAPDLNVPGKEAQALC